MFLPYSLKGLTTEELLAIEEANKKQKEKAQKIEDRFNERELEKSRINEE